MLIELNKGWKVLQDVHEIGEVSNIFRPTFHSDMIGGGSVLMPAWVDISRLEHLQLTFAENPYYGFGLRQFNAAPWWYRTEFTVEEDLTGYAVLTFEGVDYFADVYLNEQLLGSHEGYGTPFSFEVGDLIKKGEPNLLVIKVSAPWENDVLPQYYYDRVLGIQRNQMKGTYEHSDTFVPRDVNPIGIWNKVTLEIHEGVRNLVKPLVDAVPSDDFTTATISASYQLENIARYEKVQAVYTVREVDSGDVVTTCTDDLTLKPFDNTINKDLILNNPKLWTIYEWGHPHLYTITIELFCDGKKCYTNTQRFGIRRIEVVRTETETSFYLNGKKLYIRGATYFPDIYISAMNLGRYQRDLDAAQKAGMNALRLHVHPEKDEWYDLCDERGVLLIQDSDFNWVHPIDAEWGARATNMYRDMILRLKNHPSIFCWVCLNEPRCDSYLTETPGPQMMEVSKQLDPNRPYILSSWAENDLNSGDSHNYEGSLFGQDRHYTDIYGTTEKFNTEFGMDAIPRVESLEQQPKLYQLLENVTDRIDEIQYYQYRYIKYFIEHYRIQKFNPCSGHFVFLFGDAAPTSFFGVYDWYGIPKYSYRALEESNQPIGIFMETKKHEPVALWAVNDLQKSLSNVVASWRLFDENGSVILKGEQKITLKANSVIRLRDFDFAPDEVHEYTVELRLINENGEQIIKNVYEKAFNPPEHPQGHPEYVHHRFGMRMFAPWTEKIL